jgi:ABC-2 type transport system permease protein
MDHRSSLDLEHEAPLVRCAAGREPKHKLQANTFWGQTVAFVALAIATARARLAYKGSALMAAASSAFGFCIFILVWSAVYRDNSAHSGVRYEDLLPYLVVALSANTAQTLNVEARFGVRLRLGVVVHDLLRPMGFLAFQLGQAVGDLLANALFAIPVYTLGLVLVGPSTLPPHPMCLVAGAASFVLAFLITFGVSYLWLQVAFVSNALYGMVQARLALHQIFSGVSAPLIAFPSALRLMAGWLPFRDTIETPVRIWLGQAPAESIAYLLLRQAAWATALLSVGAVLFNSAVRRHQVQGG